MKITLHRRGGFTLIELIVVIGIIILLAALTVGAVFRVREAQLEKNTNTTLQKVHIGFMQQWDATRDQIAAEQIPVPIRTMTQQVTQAGNPPSYRFDPARAKAVWMKLRMRQEFPSNFGEARSTMSLSIDGQVANFPTRPSLLAAMQDASGPDYMENAALLYLIMTQGKGGVTFNAETVPTRVIDIPRAPPATGTIQFKVFVDEYFNASDPNTRLPVGLIGFRRQADDDNVALIGSGQFSNQVGLLGELNEPPYVTQAQVTSGNRDREDPEGRLRLPRIQWYTAPTLVVNGQPAQNVNARDFFLRYLSQPNPAFRPFVTDPFDGRNRGPFVFSPGKDNAYPTDDDLYSHRLQQQGKGN